MKHSKAAELFPIHVQEHIDRKILSAGGMQALPADAILSDATYAHVTADALRLALSEYSIDPAKGKGWEWLARAVKIAFTCSTPYSALNDDHHGNAPIRDKFLGLGKRAVELAKDLEVLSDEERRIIDNVFNEEARAIMATTIPHVTFLGESLEIIAGALKVPQGKWKSSAARELRVRQAHYLSPIFEAAFGRSATVNDRPGANDLGPWATFFLLVAEVATLEPVASLREVLKEARRRHMANPIRYPDLDSENLRCDSATTKNRIRPCDCVRFREHLYTSVSH
ncbi:hypothetical protein OKA06_13380 [Novosphingobium sp. MW5]|nr:hypothetical protein [Novosphingobium sp. MW5]